ncbi:MAG: gliding motility-associated ABC transporter ATP-binding subunit GldA [Bacteroidetes bacterium RIFOXYA12_FULL_35_11]|nr:MAG: gliding motility-associated ABC transporter ATP-binding subunit GldA [Bacteroidetes bacterium GWF2_35_48]OFY81667.1 MAG: gliding motility-associated ABC transporter ATP-binding subunit GldA [Bacteroidetes bacterium RIFOXYA12_FULL_35_11]OFY97829.1 MAG: gliding motility-associated ABC transporter ATP-binding subunit GldA [Bacteroidetes bacterium RIFOXYC12_FULL_35_7]HBX50241.1 gliding motility-associated ABC transporter ATP-binding subunit GldA [Bacteroidales bacterium]
MSISVKNITKIYGEQKALDNVSFDINTGEIVGFIGPNGAGKSTMMKIITGLIPATSGEVFVNEKNVNDSDLHFRNDIGYLPENNPLYTDMYIREYLEFVAGLYKLGVNARTRIDQMIHQVGLEAEIRKKIRMLSKGYKQRVGLAQALIHDPKILILDEPTSGLDPNQIIEIRNLIAETGKEKTVMLSTHILQEVEAICHRVIIINNGVIVANDSAEKLITENSRNLQTIIVEFDAGMKKEVLEQINNVTKVIHVKLNTWLIQSNAEKDLRPEIFQFAVKNGLTVLSMQKHEKSLEEVFHELTK